MSPPPAVPTPLPAPLSIPTPPPLLTLKPIPPLLLDPPLPPPALEAPETMAFSPKNVRRVSPWITAQSMPTCITLGGNSERGRYGRLRRYVLYIQHVYKHRDQNNPPKNKIRTPPRDRQTLFPSVQKLTLFPFQNVKRFVGLLGRRNCFTDTLSIASHTPYPCRP